MAGWLSFFKRLKLLFKIGIILSWTVLKRFFLGPTAPKWSLKLEVLLKVMQSFRNEVPVLEKARASFERTAAPVTKPVTQQPHDIIRKDGTALPVEWIYPEGTPTIEESKSKKIILYLHGGAYCLGSIATHRKMSSYFAIGGNCQSLLVDYRLAPESPFPAALEDAELAYDYLVETCGVSESQIVVIGDSAGGGLSLCLSLSLIAKNRKGPGAVVCLSPWVNLDFSAELSQDLKDGIDGEIVAQLHKQTTLNTNTVTDYLPEDTSVFSKFAEAYGGQKLHHELISPVYAHPQHLSLLPPTLFIVGGGEQLCGQIEVMANRMKQHNPRFECEIYQDMPHVFQFMGFLEETRAATKRVTDFINDHVEEKSDKNKNNNKIEASL